MKKLQLAISCITLPLAASLSSVANAQAAPIAEAQLNSGFLRDQNERLTSQDAPSDASYISRASAALDQQDYARALAILRPYRRSHDLAYYLLSGLAHQGQGDYAAARKDLTEAIRRRKSFIGAHFALGLMEAEHGDRLEAKKILEYLKAQQSQCAGKCRDAGELDAAIETIEAALRARPA